MTTLSCDGEFEMSSGKEDTGAGGVPGRLAEGGTHVAFKVADRGWWATLEAQDESVSWRDVNDAAGVGVRDEMLRIVGVDWVDDVSEKEHRGERWGVEDVLL